MIAESTSETEPTAARTALVIPPSMNRGMDSGKPRKEDGVYISVPNLLAEGATKTPLEDTRRQPKFRAGKNRQSSTPVVFDHEGNLDDPEVFGQAPWFKMDAVKDVTIINRYTYNGFLPGGIPLSTMETESWRHQ